MDLSPEMRDLIVRTARDLPVGARRRRYVADTITTLGLGQRQAQLLFGWARDTIRKALHERRSGITCQDAVRCRGRTGSDDQDGRDGQSDGCVSLHRSSSLLIR